MKSPRRIPFGMSPTNVCFETIGGVGSIRTWAWSRLVGNSWPANPKRRMRRAPVRYPSLANHTTTRRALQGRAAGRCRRAECLRAASLARLALAARRGGTRTGGRRRLALDELDPRVGERRPGFVGDPRVARID